MSVSLEILGPSYEGELAALGLFDQFADREINFTECVSFVSCVRDRSMGYISSIDIFSMQGSVSSQKPSK